MPTQKSLFVIVGVDHGVQAVEWNQLGHLQFFGLYTTTKEIIIEEPLDRQGL